MLPVKKISCDFCVVGGGLAGICAAVAAAREGLSVVLMQERPVLGGNASSEIRMWVCGAQGDNVSETGIMEEIFMENLRINPHKNHSVFDSILWNLVKKESNITLLLNCSCMNATMDGDHRIENVCGWQMTTQTFIQVSAKLFADCSGDSILAPLTGAAFRVGREDCEEFGEDIPLKKADRQTMGNSCLIQAHKDTVPNKFIAPDFAKKLTDEDVKYRCPDLNDTMENFWYLELGGTKDTIADAETIRDDLVALAYGMWDYCKNSGRFADADYWKLDFIGFLPGKRESRRMVGPYLMTQRDITENKSFFDVVAFGGWPLDDHDPAGFYYDGHPNTSYDTPAPYAIPFRSLYSVNIDNLLFAGRNISMTHAAMSSTRVMATCGVCGQAVGTAAAVAVRHATTPNGVLKHHLDELQSILLWNECLLPGKTRKVSTKTKEAILDLNGAQVQSLEMIRNGKDRNDVFETEAGSVIRYTFKTKTHVSGIRIVFDSDLNRETLPGDRCERVHMTRCNILPSSPTMQLPTTLCKSYDLFVVFEDGRKQIIRSETQNARRLVIIPIDISNVKCVCLKLNAANSNGTRMRIFSFDVV